MKYKIKKESEFEKNLEIKVEIEDLEDHRDEAIKKIGKQIKVDGFRTGKIPANIVKREVGEDYINEEAIELFLPQTLFSILNDEEISPATRPAIKEIKKEKNHFDVNVLITLWPTLSKLPKLSQTVEVDSIAPTDEEIADQIERIKSQFAEVSKVERPLNSGDFAMINLSATKNGIEVKDFTYNDYLYEVGTGALTPSLDSKLEGVAPGAIIKFNDSIPQLNEENVEVTVLLKEVREKILPELTDEWVSETTEFENVDSLKKELVVNIENVKKQQIASQYQGQLTNKLIEEVDMKLPEQLVIAEMDSILQNFLNELKQSNIQLEDYFKITGLTEETLRDDLNKQASRNLTMVLILDKVIADLDMKLDEKDIALVDEHMVTHKDDAEDSDQSSHRMNLEAESLRNKAMLHILQQGISVDKDGEKVYLQDVYNRDTDLGEEE
ncbi:trigger factor [Acidimicrobiaceae bacterium]|nr:trigger factor [Acidimicrobiia bacterium]MDA7850163.1 trigger factor [Acidimicrobiaceae bacterium]MDA7548229.1 trigger factor [Acidimicrobiia bacterium]MDB4813954.1 trigger factor [Acidimicrobiia bacterium]MDB4834187.1 trigger factor [Acidimicrobiia bacterium]